MTFARGTRARAGAAGLALTLGVAALAFAFDRAVKWAVVELLDLETRLVIDIAPPWITLLMAWNRGANFGIGRGLAAWGWAAIALAISAGLLFWSLRLASPLQRAAIGLLVGGALSNALDRLIYGAVADFLNVSCCGLANPYAFHPADIFIFAGALGLILAPRSDKQEG